MLGESLRRGGQDLNELGSERMTVRGQVLQSTIEAESEFVPLSGTHHVFIVRGVHFFKADDWLESVQ